MRPIRMVDLYSQYEKISGEIDSGIAGVIRDSAFINGKPVKEFSRNLEAYLGARHVIPCANGTDALQIALMAVGCKPGDEVITVPFTFVATVEVVALLGLKPIFVDIDKRTFNMDTDQIESAITPRTKAIVPVHLYGQSCDMEPIMKIARKHGIMVIEDNAQATGATYKFSDGKKQKTGTIGDIGCTSFYPTKNLGAFGDGGALCTNNDALAEKLHIVTNHGSDRKYYYDSIGVNSRLDSMQAVILNVKLKHLDAYRDARRKAAKYYDRQLGDIDGVTIPFCASYALHVYHQYTLQVEKKRDELQQTLQKAGIPSMIYYPVPLHLSNAYRKFGYKEGDFPVCERLSEKVISLPMHTELEDEQLELITDTICQFVKTL